MIATTFAATVFNKTYPLGWVPGRDRTPEQQELHEAAVATMPREFRLRGAAPDPGPLVSLIDLWRHPDAVAATGFEFTGTHQITGSCVGAGGGNVEYTVTCVEALKRGEPERIIVPFWLFPYGLSRMLLGETTEGEGSLGSTLAEAVIKFGWFSQDEPGGLPPFENTDGLVWGERAEMTWSNGKKIGKQWLDVGAGHLIKTVTPLRSSAEVRDAIRNLYPVTFASNWFMQPGTERLKGSGANAAVIGTLNGNGGHQTSLQAVWDNPENGLLFWNQNQWGLKVYKQDPTIGRGSGAWMPASEVDRAIRSGDAEVYAWSQYDGYPAQTMSWVDILPRVRTSTVRYSIPGDSRCDT